MWLTGAGMEGAGLGGVRPVKSPPGATTITHGVLVGWSAARIERRGRVWKAARELAVESERWAVRMRCERGYTDQLPDLAGWLRHSSAPIAVIAESGGRREDRQKMILEGWRDAIWAGRYAAVRYDCASQSVAHWIARLAKKVGLAGSTFTAVVQTTAEEIAALCPAADDVDELPVSNPQPCAEAAEPRDQQVQNAPVCAPLPAPPVHVERPEPQPETPEEAAERKRQYREIFGIDDPVGLVAPARRRRWRR